MRFKGRKSKYREFAKREIASESAWWLGD